MEVTKRETSSGTVSGADHPAPAETVNGDDLLREDKGPSPSAIADDTFTPSPQPVRSPSAFDAGPGKRKFTFYAALAIVILTLLWAMLRRMSAFPSYDQFWFGISIPIGIIIGSVPAIMVFLGAGRMSLRLACFATMLSFISLFLGDLLAIYSAFAATPNTNGILELYVMQAEGSSMRFLISYFFVIGGTLAFSWEIWKSRHLKRAAIQR